ncbi:MAG: thioredoxin family protein [Planctomycetota bacterium]
MKTTARFYHAGCPVCVSAEENMARSLDPERYEVESIHLGEDNARLGEAKAAGVKSVPALVLNDQVFHINFGASLSDLE